MTAAAVPGADSGPADPDPDPLLVGLTRQGDRWHLPVSRSVANVGDNLYGGAALGASVEVAGIETGWPVRWASTRFLLGPRVGDELSMTCEVTVAGRRTCHATVRATTERGLAFETMVVAGCGDERDHAVAGQWVSMPAVPEPGACVPTPVPAEFANLAFGRVERRQAFGFEPVDDPAVDPDSDPGHRAVWARFAEGNTASPAALAWVADCVAMGIGKSFGGLSRATSLDNTIRYTAPGRSEWILVDVHATASADGYAYGVVHLFAEDGRLLGTGEQTCLVRTNETADPWGGLRRQQ